MRVGTARRVTSVVVAVVAALVGVVGMPARPARADLLVYLSATVNISATFNFGGSNAAVLRAIEEARRQILTEIAASEDRILAHIDGTEAAHVATCIRSAKQLLRGIDNPLLQDEYGERINQANQASHCANEAGEKSRSVATTGIADYLGFAMAEINAIATVMRAWAGLDLESQLTGYIADYERLVPRLEPQCRSVRIWPGGIPDPDGEMLIHTTCTAYSGAFARYTQQFIGGTEQNPPADVEALKAQAAANTSWPLARTALPELRRSLAMVQRDFVVAAAGEYINRDGVHPGQTWYWHEDGPLSWIRLGNPGTATAIASAIGPGDRRDYVAVLGGQVHHRFRNRDGGWTAWTALPHGGTATDVTVAVHPDGSAHVAAVLDGQVHHRIRASDTAWTPWALLGNPGRVTSLGSAVFHGDLHLAAVVDGQVRKVIRSAAGGWSGWEDLGHPGTATSIAAVADPQGVFQLAAVVDGRFQHRGWYAGSGWTAWASPGANPGTATEVTGAADPAGNVQWVVAARHNGGHDAFLRTRYPTAWTEDWVRMGITQEGFGHLSGIAAS